MGLPNFSKVTAAFRSKDAFLEAIKTPEAPSDRPTVGKGHWTNRDLEPTPPEERNWAWYVFVCPHERN
jgi:NCS1 family nucleobase:cation symporter-1